jgi:serine/threonine protein phosphatase PrpC
MTTLMEDTHLMEALISAAWLTDVGRVRNNNEDALIVADLSGRTFVSDSGEASLRRIDERGWLLAVSDGVGGAQAGEVASRIATERLVQIVASATENTPVPASLRDGLSSANRQIRRVSQERPECQGMGATMTAAIIHGDGHEGRAVIGQVGDSRGYLIRAGRIQQITKDQSVVQALIDAGMMTPEEAAHSSRRNVILKALGAKDEIEPDLSQVALARGDHLLLCSDGLSDKVDDVEMRDIALNAKTLDAACARLAALANERGGEDNITVILARFDGAGLPAPETSDGRRIPVEHL